MPAFSVRGSSNATTQRQEGTHVAKTGEEELVEINQSKQGKPESWRQLRDLQTCAKLNTKKPAQKEVRTLTGQQKTLLILMFEDSAPQRASPDISFAL